MRFILKLMLVAVMSGSAVQAYAASNVNTPIHETQERESAKIHAQLGGEYFVHGQMLIARTEFERSTLIDPTFSGGFSGLGLVYSRLGMNKEAGDNFSRAVAISPKDPEVRNNYGAFLCSIDQIEDSLVQLKQAFSDPLYETPEMALTNAGQCLIKVKRYSEAETYLHQAILRNEQFLKSRSVLADMYIQQGLFEKAKVQIEMVMDQSAPSPEVLAKSIQIDRQLGNLDEVASHELFLKNKFPKSKEAKEIKDAE